MQEAIVTVIVAIAAVAVIRRYTPQSVQQVCSAWAARTAQRLGWHTLEKQLSAPAAASCADGCGACKGCGPDAVPKNRFVITLDDLKAKK